MIVSLVVVVLMGGGLTLHTLAQGDHRIAQPFKPQLNPNGTELVVRGYQVNGQPATDGRVTLTGSLQPRYQSAIGFRVAGKISDREVEVGSLVKQGDLLFKLDPTDYELQLRMAEAEVTSAEATLKQARNEASRLEKLRAISAISQSEFDMIIAARDVAEARLESAKKRLDSANNQAQYCQLKADRDGLVVGVIAEVGQVVNIGQPVVTLMQGSELEALVSVPENQIELVRAGSATAAVWSDKSSRYPAELRELSPMADATTRTFDARFRLLQVDSKLAPGMTASIELSSQSSGELRVPMSALTKQLDQAIVWKIDLQSGAVTAIPVSVQSYGTDFAAVLGDLRAGDWIVSAGVQRIDQAVKVRLWSESRP